MSDITIAVVYPDLLGTYGDGGNATILARRLEWRGISASVMTIPYGTALPETCDIYTLGGGEDAPQALAATALRSGVLAAAVDRGAAVLAVCAGFQVIGTRFRTTEGIHDGVGLVDAVSVSALPARAVGELVVRAEGLPVLSGYENHATATELGRGVTPFATVGSGYGNGDGVDGCRMGKVLGTYMHGPVLARNPEVADLLLSWVAGELPPLDHPVNEEARDLRASRLDAVGYVA